MDNPMKVRKAQPSDEAKLYAHLMGLHEENGLAPVSEAKVLEEIRRATETRGGIIGLIDGDNGIEASIGLTLSSFWYTDDFHLQERWVYVTPPYRRLDHAKRLLVFGKWVKDEMSKAAGIEIPLFLGILTRKKLEGKMRLYQRQFPQVGALFAYGPVPEGSFNQRRPNGRH